MSVPLLSDQPLNLSALITRVASPERGGVACFLGVVRDHHEGRRVLRLEYSAYGPMAEAEAERIVAEATAKWDVAVALVHRTGTLEVGETAVAIAAAAAHRDAAFAACRYLIEQVKRRVPIWKREHYTDGTADWVDPTRPRSNARGAAGQAAAGGASGAPGDAGGHSEPTDWGV